MKTTEAYTVTADLPFQCVVCGEKLSEMPKDGKCSYGHPNVRDVEATGGMYDVTSEEQVAHFKKKMTVCWNQKRLPNGSFTSHPFQEEFILAVNLSNQETHRELHCATCHEFYARYDGRAATPEEMDKCRKGEIPRAAGKSKMLGN